MKGNFCGVELAYECDLNGAANGVIVFLHGWGGDLSSFSGAYRGVSELGYGAVNIAFPKTVPQEWGIYDYAAQVKELLRALDVSAPIVVGHSFGGRVGLILAAQGVCSRLVLVDSAGMRPRFSLTKRIKIARYRYRVRQGKPLDGMGSIDYNNTSENMRGVFVRVVNTHLEKLLAYITCPTLIVWGREDGETPPYMARRLNRGIKGSRLVYFDGGHYCYLTSHYAFMRQLNTFVSERK